MVKLKTCKDHAIKAGLGPNWLGWGGRLPPPRCRVQSAASREDEDERGRGVATVAAGRGGGARPGWLRALAVSSSAAWLPKRPARVGPPEPLPPLQLDLDDPDGKFVNKPYSYSIDLNLATRMTRAYDVGTFTVVPLIWNCGAGLDQDTVEKIVKACPCDAGKWTLTIPAPHLPGMHSCVALWQRFIEAQTATASACSWARWTWRLWTKWKRLSPTCASGLRLLLRRPTDARVVQVQRRAAPSVARNFTFYSWRGVAQADGPPSEA